MKIAWRNLQELVSQDFPQIERKPGIYFLRWVKDGEPVIITRIAESDSNGLLYVGETKDLRRRFQRIWRGINLEPKAKSDNIPTIRKAMFFCKIHEVIKIDEYEVAWQQLASNVEAESQEAAALKLYSEKFKEPPPLNLKFCREKYAIWGLGDWGDSKWLVPPNEYVKSIML